jgi:hypothetical protein
MPITVTWDNDDQTAIRYDFDGRWTWSEFHRAANEAFALTRSVTQTVDSISYFKPGVTLPPDALFQFRHAMADAPSNRGTTVIVGGSAFIVMMVSIFSKLNKALGERLLVANSLDQARALLAARRQSRAADTP